MSRSPISASAPACAWVCHDPRKADPAAAQLSDEGLLASSAVGDHVALGVLFERHHRPLYGFLSRLVGADVEVVDDLVQATFLAAVRGAARFRAASSVRTWLFGIGANLVRHHVRSAIRERAAHARLRETEGEGGVRPDRAAEQGELLARLGRALAELPHDLRVAYVMCAVEEVPGVEVARVLDVPEGTGWRRLHEARRRLRAAIEGGQP